MADDVLMLNISSDPFKCPTNYYQRSLLSAEKYSWKGKKKKSLKRKAAFEPQENSAFKQRKINQTGQQHTHTQKLQSPRSPSQRNNNRHTEETGDQRENSAAQSPSKVKTFPKKAPEEHKDHGRPFIKTSSLFKNNPVIHDVHSPAVTQVKENVFTNNTFEELNLHRHLVATLEKVLKVTSMTSVQKQSIPVLMIGKDAVIRSQTGSGKTLAYAIPMVQSLQAIQPKVKRSDGPLALIIVPTRELALQTFKMFQNLMKAFIWIVPGVLMGGEKKKSEKARLRKGINVLISTPGRLVDHIRNTLSIVFSSVRWLILDEADRTLDLGFEKDLTVILNALNSTGIARQNVLLSATLNEGLSRLASISMKDPVTIHVSEGSKGMTLAVPQTGIQALSDSYSVPERLKQHVVVVPSKLHLVCLASFILAKCKFECGQKVIVFMSSCDVVEFLLTLFTKVLCAKSDSSPANLFNLYKLHGNMKQEERTEVFQEFSQCQTGILLCTDVAARGLDLAQVTWIVQYNPPFSVEEYVHRVGRTARIGAQGSSLLFLTPSETAFVDVLANHNISLSEMKMISILSALMRDSRFKGRGKWDSKGSGAAFEQEVRERATVLQTDFENYVHANNESLQTAKSALQSFLRAYTTYPSSLKHIFHIRSLHLGHAAKSFGLRDAPNGLAGSITPYPANCKDRKKGKDKRTPPTKLTTKERASNLIRSEFFSGVEGQSKSKKRRIKRKGNTEDSDAA
ncbi:probable ATP-dependent RNA helicase DDX31 [Triplophysa dalaica]|uniref:probable ATP-dependent RNA helicase DDX31 n=1 Tax=Triplophysa dalaica TaxID=1582913 RepID=UPI0024E0338F|nr:probable ATP-dependent RNA helicase DDX31 [Triplophysa dalaica]